MGEVGSGGCDGSVLRFAWHRDRFLTISGVVEVLGCVPMFPLAKVGNVEIIGFDSLCDGVGHDFLVA